jgi:UDP-glucuronate decarboxylase
MRILVTGAAGFLGSHLVDRLLIEGHEVLAVDNFFTGSKNNLAHLADNKNLEIMRHDITFPLYVEVDQIYNLASPASPINYQRDPVQTLKTNVIGAVNMLGLAKRLNARIFQASTSEVYGDPQVSPQNESYWGNVNPIGIRSCYDEGKRAAETLFFDYQRQHGVEVRVARIFNTYGPRMAVDDGRVVSNFIVQALRGENLTIYGDGQQKRSFTFVSDVVEPLFKAATLPEAHGQVINVGPDKESTTVIELAEKIAELLGFELKPIFMPDRPREVKIALCSADKARTLLGYEPTTDLDEGLEDLVNFIQSRGAVEFDYYLELEIQSEKTPKTWSERLM